MNKKVRTILMGTPEFAAEIFKKTYPKLKDKLEIITVITAPDKPVGRKQLLMPSPVKKWALETNLSVLEPIKIREKEWIDRIKELNSDLMILTAYGQIIPKEILDIPKYRALNIHPSLLPKYRGASPIQATVLNGDKETGVTIILMDEKMDHGDIISNFQFPIFNKITYKELENKLVDIAAELLIKTLPDWIAGKIKSQPQDHSKATFCKLIKKEDGKIDWNKSAEEIGRQIRAYQKWPESYTDFNGKILKILEADAIKKPRIPQQVEVRGRVGEVFLTDNKELAVQTGNGILILKQLQPESKKPMSGKDFLNGHPEIIETSFQ